MTRKPNGWQFTQPIYEPVEEEKMRTEDLDCQGVYQVAGVQVSITSAAARLMSPSWAKGSPLPPSVLPQVSYYLTDALGRWSDKAIHEIHVYHEKTYNIVVLNTAAGTAVSLLTESEYVEIADSLS